MEKLLKEILTALKAIRKLIEENKSKKVIKIEERISQTAEGNLTENQDRVIEGLNVRVGKN